VLLADSLDAMRASLAGFLRSQGVDVVEVTGDLAVRELRSAQDERHYDALIAGLEGRGAELLKAVRLEQPSLPVVCVGRENSSAVAEQAGVSCVKRVEREAVLEALVNVGIFSAQVRAS
jgi:DNA-binding NarL/FixJ family response regulator